ncbi:MAG: hypothetical protein FIB08_06925 [Candidatus Methanoperedens sp.]|nr:hypothetical protein [Candidatus Methanoperedens sp.]
MELKDINIPEGVVQQTDHEGPFADANVDIGNAICPNINLDVLYENTIADIENNWSSWKTVDEINIERARYLLNTDDMLEEMLSKSQE